MGNAVVIALAPAVILALASCAPPPPSADVHDHDGAVRPPPPRPIESERIVRALEAENAALRRRLQELEPADQARPAGMTGLINAHEHLKSARDLERYLPAARGAGIATTVVVSSPTFTLMGSGPQGEPSMSENFEALMATKKQVGEALVVFATLDPEDNDKLARLKRHVAAGAQGLKLYSGHSNFCKGALVGADMEPVLAYLEETGLPVNWHINLSKFMADFDAVMQRHPRLNVMVPHYGVVFWRKGDLAKLATLMQKHPSVYVDTSLGTREILLDGMAAMEPQRDEFRAFFDAFQDRIVWGTDSVITGNVEKTPGWYTKVIWATRDQLERDVFHTELAAGYSKYFQKGRDAEGRYEGLALSAPILRKVYVDNARRWLRLGPASTAQEPTPAP